jgi:AcrR family transcriptional regulator
MANARRSPSTKRGAVTYEALLRASASVFGRHGFRQASVAEICRRSRVANGTFYQYFPDKEHIFLKLMELMTHQLQRRLRADPTASALEQIQSILKAHLDFISSQTTLYRVFREAEFIHAELPKQLYGQLAGSYERILERGTEQFRPIEPEAVAFALIGMAEFIALRYIFWGRGLPPNVWTTLRTLIAHGIHGDRPIAPAVPLPMAQEPIAQFPQTPKRTRTCLLEAAEAEFGEKGFYEAQVVDITRRAGVAHGTFYTYFPSKEAIFVELVREINNQLRARLRAAIAGLQDRRQIERAGFHAFFDFIKNRAQAYRIVREAEFVGSPENTVGRWYYERLAQGYAPALAKAMAAGHIQELDPEALAYALMGIGHFIALRWVVWESQAVPDSVFASMMDFILHGLLPLDNGP